ncbi:TetR/AcrR family transcriptional regulator [Nocardioides stalactiti]|uniref:TetR/AcrR family transcriptional regulator n=1 Tax=Nocardioides stalactiti TaxID=2755356 RepID=UPI0016034738|nr:TetR/AcrR family transcriptional regulator [Nocardioides stalactiti]
MATPTRAYGGLSAEQRQAERRARLLDAALTVIGEDGTAALTVHRVCRTAGLNERYYYESFPERDDLVRAVAEDAGSRLILALTATIATTPDDPRTQATAVIGAGIDLFSGDPRLGRLMVESAGHPVLSEVRTGLTTALLGMIVERGLTTLKIEHTPQVDKDATFAATLLLGGMIEVLTAWTAGTLQLDRDELVERCVEVFLLIGDQAVRRS